MGTDIHGKLRVKNWKKEWDYHELPYLFDQRDYDFFAILANVRNGYGFGGSQRYKDCKPVKSFTDDRGLPDGINNDEDYGDHSFGWISLFELKRDVKLASQQVIRTGVIPLQTYRSLKKGSSPDEWSGFISGQGVRTISENDVTDDIIELEDERIFVQYSWKDRPFKDKINKLIAWMECYQTYQDDTGDDVQLIFGFDS